MYAAHFGLKDYPFAITPDPGYLYLSPYHQEALAHLLYGTEEHGGFVQLTGEVGTGKTTLIRTLLGQQLDKVDVALCLNPKLTVLEFVATICDELQIDYPKDSTSLKPLIDTLNQHLLQSHANGRRTVVIIDEAQNLSHEVLEQVRLLTNLETHRDKLLRIILVGQPELQQMLARPELRQLAQRITARYHLAPLNRRETTAYVAHRLNIAGSHSNLFSNAALRRIYRRSGGVPRLINIICDRALLGAYVNGYRRVDPNILRDAAQEVLGGNRRKRKLKPWFAGASLALLVAVSAGIYWQWPTSSLALLSALTQIQPSEPEQKAAADTVAIVTEPKPEPKPEPKLEPKLEPELEPVPIEPASLPIPAASAASSDISDPPASFDLAGELLKLDATVPHSAMQRLLQLWDDQLVITTSSSPCQAIETRNLRCLSGRTDWTTLRRYNRPTVLDLISPDGDIRQVMVRELNPDHALLDWDERSQRVDLDQLDPLWTGNYLLLWRPPVAQSLIGPGSRGAAVAWLRRQLALASEQPLLEPLSDLYDADLEQQVRRFQRSQQLQIDGLVGAQTLLLLNNIAPAPNTPLLVPADQV